MSKDVWEGNILRGQSLNGWTYVEGNPISQIDPSGKTPVSRNLCQSPSCKIEVQMRNVDILAVGLVSFHGTIIFTEDDGKQTEHTVFPSEASEEDTLVDLTRRFIFDPGLPIEGIPLCKTMAEAIISGDFESPICELYASDNNPFRRFSTTLPFRGGPSLFGFLEPHNGVHEVGTIDWAPEASRLVIAEGAEVVKRNNALSPLWKKWDCSKFRMLL